VVENDVSTRITPQDTEVAHKKKKKKKKRDHTAPTSSLPLTAPTHEVHSKEKGTHQQDPTHELRQESQEETQQESQEESQEETTDQLQQELKQESQEETTDQLQQELKQETQQETQQELQKETTDQLQEKTTIHSVQLQEETTVNPIQDSIQLQEEQLNKHHSLSPPPSPPSSPSHRRLLDELQALYPQFRFDLIGSGVFSDEGDLDVVVTCDDADLVAAYARVVAATK